MFHMSSATGIAIAVCLLARICLADFPVNHDFDRWEGAASEARASRDIIFTQGLHERAVLPPSTTAASFSTDDPSGGGADWRRVHAWVARQEHKRALAHLEDVWTRAIRAPQFKQSPAQQFEHWLATFWIGVADEAVHSNSDSGGAAPETAAILERAQQHMQQLVAGSPARQSVLACIGLLAPHSDPSSQYAACKVAVGHTSAPPKGLWRKNKPKKASSKNKTPQKDAASVAAFGNYSRGLVRLWRGHATLDAISAGAAIPGSHTSMSPDHLCSDFEVAVALGALDARQGLIECRYWLASFERRANVLEAQTTQCTSHLSDGSSNSDIRKKSSNTQRSEDGSSSSRISASKDNENDGSTCVDSQKEPAQVRAVRRLEYNPGANLTVTLDAAWRLAAAQGAPLVLTERSAPSNSGASNANADDDADTVNLSSLQSTKEAATVAWLRAACSGAVADDFGLRGRGYAGTADGGFSQTNGQTFPAATDPSAPPAPPVTLGAVLAALGNSPRSHDRDDSDHSSSTRSPPRSSSPVSQVQWARWQASSACPRLLPSLQSTNSSAVHALRHLRAPKGSPLDATHAWQVPPVAAFALRVGGVCWPAAVAEGNTSASSSDDHLETSTSGNRNIPDVDSADLPHSLGGGCAPVSPMGALSIAASTFMPDFSFNQATSIHGADGTYSSAAAGDYAIIDSSGDSAWQLWVNSINDEDSATNTASSETPSSLLSGSARLHVDALASHHAVTMLSGTKEYVVFPESDSDLLGLHPFAGGFLPAFPGEERVAENEERSQPGSGSRKEHLQQQPQYPVDSAAAASVLGAAALALPIPLADAKHEEGVKGHEDVDEALAASKAGSAPAKRRSLKRTKKSKSTAKVGGLEAWAFQRMRGTKPWRFVLQPGDTLLLPAGCVHAFRVVGDKKPSSSNNNGGAVFLGRNFVDATNHRRALLSAANAALHPLFAPPPLSHRSNMHSSEAQVSRKGDNDSKLHRGKESDQKASANAEKVAESQGDDRKSVEVNSHSEISDDGHKEAGDPGMAEYTAAAPILSLSPSAASDLEAVALLASLPYLAQQAAELPCCRYLAPPQADQAQNSEKKDEEVEKKKYMNCDSNGGDEFSSKKIHLISSNEACPWTTAVDDSGVITASCIGSSEPKNYPNNGNESNTVSSSISAPSPHACKGTDSACCLASVEAYLASCIAAKKMHGYSFDKTVSLLVPWLAIGGKPDEGLLDYRTPITKIAAGSDLSLRNTGSDNISDDLNAAKSSSGRRVTHIINCLSAASHPAVAAAFEQGSSNTSGNKGSNDDVSMNGDTRMLQLYLNDDGDDEKLLQVLPSVVAFVRSALRHSISDTSTATSLLPLVYVHCQSGVNRAPSVAMALLIALEQRTLVDAFALVRAVRPSVRPKYLAVVSHFEELTLKQSASAPALRDGPNSTAIAQFYNGLQNDHSLNSTSLSSENLSRSFHSSKSAAADDAPALLNLSNRTTASSKLLSQERNRSALMPPFRAWPCAVPELAACNGEPFEPDLEAKLLSLKQLLADCNAVDKVGKAIVSATAAAAAQFGTTNAARSDDIAAALPTGTFWLPAGSPGRFGLESLVAQVFEAHTRERSATSKLAGAEWWVKIDGILSDSGRPIKNSKGIKRRSKRMQTNEKNGGFHFDSDSTLLRVAHVHRHPYLSTVTYLSTGDTKKVGNSGAVAADVNSSCLSGSPTMVLDWTAQQLRDQNKTSAAPQSAIPVTNGSMAVSGCGRRAWLAWPSVGQHIAFHGRFMHGVPSELRRSMPCSAASTKAFTKKATAANEKTRPAPDSTATKNSPRVVLVVNIWLDAPPFQVSAFPVHMARNLSRSLGLTSLQLDSTTVAVGEDSTSEAKGPIVGGDPTVIQVPSDTPRIYLAIDGAADSQTTDNSGALTSSARVDAAFPADILTGHAAADLTALEVVYAPEMEVRVYG